jgi:hypothetical protein
VWFSGSFPLQFSTKVSDPIEGMKLNADGNFDKQVRATAALLAAARGAVYPVDARGVLVAVHIQCSEPDAKLHEGVCGGKFYCKH